MLSTLYDKSVKFLPLPISVLSPWWSHKQWRAQLENLNSRDRVDWICFWDHPPPEWGTVFSATRGHQLHGKERVEFRRLSPLPCNEYHLINCFLLEQSLGVVDTERCQIYLLGKVVTLSCCLKSFLRSLPCPAIVDIQLKIIIISPFYFLSFFFYIYTPTEIDNLLSVWKRYVDERRIFTLKCFRLFERTKLMLDLSIWSHVFS